MHRELYVPAVPFATVVHEQPNRLARCLETPVACGWRCYSYVLLLLSLCLVGTAAGFGYYADRTRVLSECSARRIRHDGTYDPARHCLAWVHGRGVQAMPDGNCPHHCDRQLYDAHAASIDRPDNGRRLTETCCHDKCAETSITNPVFLHRCETGCLGTQPCTTFGQPNPNNKKANTPSESAYYECRFGIPYRQECMHTDVAREFANLDVSVTDTLGIITG